MGKDDGGGIVGQRTLDHLSGIHAGTVDAAAKQHLERQHPVLGIEKQAAKHLMRLVTQLRLEVVAYGLRAFQR